MKIFRNLLIVSLNVSLILLLGSCSSKRYAYLQDLQEGYVYPENVKYEPIIQRNDRLDIKVSCKSPALAIPFNNPYGAENIVISSEGTEVGSSASIPNKGYLVDIDGNIVFPLIGTIHLEGMTLKSAAKLIRTKIIEGNFINDPTVVIEFLNFKYTVLGAVNSRGVYTVAGDTRVTLLDALAKAGDLAQNAKLDGISVIRQTNGERQVFTHDIRSKDIFDSPAFYLQQNDIVYVQPRYRTQTAESRTVQYITLASSLIYPIALILSFVLK